MPKDKKEHKDHKDEKYADLENKLLRSVADYRNLERRVEEERTKIVKFACEPVIKNILSILDDLEASQEHLKDEGISKVITKFKKILEEEGIREVEYVGFDPNLHEAIDTDIGESGKIVNVHQKGYLLHDKVIRPALVTVGSGEEKKEKNEQNIRN